MAKVDRVRARLCAITAAYPAPSEPTRAVFLENFLDALAADGFDITVVAPRVHRQDPACETRGRIQVVRFAYPAGGRRLKELDRPCPAALAAYLGSGLAALLGAIQRRAPAMIYAHWVLPAGAIGAAAAAIAGLPMAVHAHGSDIHRYPAASRAAALAARCTLARAATVCAASADLARRMVRELGVSPRRLRVVPMGADGRYFHPGDRGAARRALGLGNGRIEILYLGDLDPWKGILEVARDFAASPDLAGRARLHVIGDGALRPQLEELERAGAGALRLHGRLPQAAVAEWCRAADLLILPSRGEGSPLAVQEALSCGLPVVAAPVGGIPELVRDGDTGWLEPRERFITRLRELASAPGRIEAARRRILESRQDLSAARRAGEAAVHLRAVLAGAPAGRMAPAATAGAGAGVEARRLP